MNCKAQCPYCWEEVEVWVDLSAASEQRYVEDCSICCRPWQVVATVEEGGFEGERQAHVALLRLDD